MVARPQPAVARVPAGETAQVREEFRRPGDVEVPAEQAQVDAEGPDRVRAGVQSVLTRRRSRDGPPAHPETLGESGAGPVA